MRFWLYFGLVFVGVGSAYRASADDEAKGSDAVGVIDWTPPWSDGSGRAGSGTDLFALEDPFASPRFVLERRGLTVATSNAPAVQVPTLHMSLPAGPAEDTRTNGPGGELVRRSFVPTLSLPDLSVPVLSLPDSTSLGASGASVPDARVPEARVPEARVPADAELGPGERSENTQHINRLSSSACTTMLAARGVTFEPVISTRDESTSAIETAVRIPGPIGGVVFGRRNDPEVDRVYDCRLALALSVWAESLVRRGVTQVDHYSVFRPGARVAGTNKESGHARALAIDSAWFHREDGSVLEVESAWTDRERGVDPCGAHENESEDQKFLRSVVCDAVSQGLFEVVLTPHHDRAHHNHVHLEVRPDVDWTYLR